MFISAVKFSILTWDLLGTELLLEQPQVAIPETVVICYIFMARFFIPGG